jgi:hypothetical protein
MLHPLLSVIVLAAPETFDRGDEYARLLLDYLVGARHQCRRDRNA